jgi:hypothetical protein
MQKDFDSSRAKRRANRKAGAEFILNGEVFRSKVEVPAHVLETYIDENETNVFKAARNFVSACLETPEQSDRFGVLYRELDLAQEDLNEIVEYFIESLGENPTKES